MEPPQARSLKVAVMSRQTNHAVLYSLLISAVNAWLKKFTNGVG